MLGANTTRRIRRTAREILAVRSSILVLDISIARFSFLAVVPISQSIIGHIRRDAEPSPNKCSCYIIETFCHAACFTFVKTCPRH